MSIAQDANDLETDWRDSEFITECLCWHNVYRQRHNAPPLTMSPQVMNNADKISRMIYLLYIEENIKYYRVQSRPLLRLKGSVENPRGFKFS